MQLVFGRVSTPLPLKAERIWIGQQMHLDAGAPLHEECAIAVREEPNVRPEFYWRVVTGAMLNSCAQRDLVSAFASGHYRSVARPECQCTLNGCAFIRTRSSTARSVVKEFQEVSDVPAV